MSSSVQKPKHEKGTFHQQNVRKQTHPDEEFENEDEPDSKYFDKEGVGLEKRQGSVGNPFFFFVPTQ